MRRLAFSLLALALLLGACGRYGPPERTYTPALSTEEEERAEPNTP